MTNTIALQDLQDEQLPGEEFFVRCLQKPIKFSINGKTIKQGRMLLFKRHHYFIHFTLSASKNPTESFEIPFPLRTEVYQEDGLVYFDYRTSSLGVNVLPKTPEKVSSSYFNKILEISVVN
jgi:hypothetical protein